MDATNDDIFKLIENIVEQMKDRLSQSFSSNYIVEEFIEFCEIKIKEAKLMEENTTSISGVQLTLLDSFLVELKYKSADMNNDDIESNKSKLLQFIDEFFDKMLSLQKNNKNVNDCIEMLSIQSNENGSGNQKFLAMCSSIVEICKLTKQQLINECNSFPSIATDMVDQIFDYVDNFINKINIQIDESQIYWFRKIINRLGENLQKFQESLFLFNKENNEIEIKNEINNVATRISEICINDVLQLKHSNNHSTIKDDVNEVIVEFLIKLKECIQSSLCKLDYIVDFESFIHDLLENLENLISDLKINLWNKKVFFNCDISFGKIKNQFDVIKTNGCDDKSSIAGNCNLVLNIILCEIESWIKRLENKDLEEIECCTPEDNLKYFNILRINNSAKAEKLSKRQRKNSSNDIPEIDTEKHVICSDDQEEKKRSNSKSKLTKGDENDKNRGYLEFIGQILGLNYLSNLIIGKTSEKINRKSEAIDIKSRDTFWNKFFLRKPYEASNKECHLNKSTLQNALKPKIKVLSSKKELSRRNSLKRVSINKKKAKLSGNIKSKTIGKKTSSGRPKSAPKQNKSSLNFPNTTKRCSSTADSLIPKHQIQISVNATNNNDDDKKSATQSHNSCDQNDDPILSAIIEYMKLYNILKHSRQVIEDERIVYRKAYNTYKDFSPYKDQYNPNVGYLIKKVFSDIFYPIHNYFKTHDMKGVCDPKKKIVSTIKKLKPIMTELYEFYKESLPKNSNVFFGNDCSEANTSFVQGWGRLTDKYDPAKEFGLSPVKLHEAVTKPNWYNSDEMFTGYTWVLKMSEQFYYTNSSVLINKNRCNFDLIKKVLKKNFMNKTAEFYYDEWIDLSLLGQGGFGDVFQVTEKSTGQFVALKALRFAPNSELSSHFNGILGYLRERDYLVKARDSPFTVRFINSLKLKNVNCLLLTFEFCVGNITEVEQLFKKHFPLPNAIDILWNNRENAMMDRFNKIRDQFQFHFLYLTLIHVFEMYCILEYLADCNIIHMDIKTDNIMLSDTLHLKLVDFGLVSNLTYVTAYSNAEMLKLNQIDVVDVLNESGICGTRTFRDVEIMCEAMQHLEVSKYKAVMAAADSRMKSALPRNGDFASDLWSMTICAICLMIGGYPFVLGIEGKIITEMGLDDLATQDKTNLRNREFYMLQICMRKDLFERLIVNGLIKAGGDNLNALMNFFVSVFNTRELRATDYTKDKLFWSMGSLRHSRMIDVTKLQQIDLFVKYNITRENVVHHKMPSKILKAMLTKPKKVKYPTFKHYVDSLKKTRGPEDFLPMQPGLGFHLE